MHIIEDRQNQLYILNALPFWNELSDCDKSILLEHTDTVRYSQGQNIHSADNDCVGVLLIKSGELRAYMLSEDGRWVTLYRLSPGDVCILSASCLLKKVTFDVHIDAEADSEVLLINANIFSQLQDKNIYVENFALRVAVEKFSDVMWAMEQMLFMKLDRRLATFLFDESAKRGSEDITLTHEQIAKYIGSAREAVSRMMKQFENDKIVSIYRGGVRIIDKNKLMRLI